MIIEDGTGAGYKGKVDLNKRVHTRSVSSTEQQNATDEGVSYNINTGDISLTSANESAVLYIKNNDTEGRILKIDSIAVGLGSAATVSELAKITVIRNPTTGTIIDGATAVDMNANRNFGSSETLTVDAYKGAEGNTFTNGEDIIQFYQGEGGRLFASIDLDLTKGSSLGVKIDPNISSGTMPVYCALVCHIKEAE